MSHTSLTEVLLGIRGYACSWKMPPLCQKPSTHIFHCNGKIAPVCEQHYDYGRLFFGKPQVIQTLRFTDPPRSRGEMGMTI